jgi:hypothetical protein
MPLSKITNPFLDPAGSARSNVYSPAANTIGIVTSGTEKVRVDANGNVSIGTTSSGGAKLRVETPSGQYGPTVPQQIWGYAGKQFLNVQMDGSVNPVFNSDPETYWSNPATMIWQYQASEKMRLDSVGRLTFPNQPRAWVSFSGTGPTSGGAQLVPFDTVTINVGSCYNASNYRFTCPIAGYYKVSSWGMRGTTSGDNNFNIYLYKNGGQYSSMVGYNYGGGYCHAGAFYIVNAAAGDYLQVYQGGGAGYYGSNLNGALYELIG